MPAMCGFFSKPIPRKDDQKEKREKIGKRSGKCSTFFSPRLENYPLVNIEKTMENQENPLFWWVKSTISMAIFNSFCMFTRPGIPVVVNPRINDQPSKRRPGRSWNFLGSVSMEASGNGMIELKNDHPGTSLYWMIMEFLNIHHHSI